VAAWAGWGSEASHQVAVWPAVGGRFYRKKITRRKTIEVDKDVGRPRPKCL
jgi:hypothetical protein